MTPDELAGRYFTCIRAKDIDGLMELYEDDATFILPDGRELQGKAAICEMQSAVFSSAAPFPTPGARVSDDNGIAVEIAARLPDGTIRNTLNFYRLSGKGLIQQLNVYMRGS